MAIPLAHAAFLRMTPTLSSMNVLALVAALLLMVPFLAAGTVVTLVLASAGPRPGRMYAANLIGSGVGCFLPLIALGPLDAPRLLGALGLVAWASIFTWVRLAQRTSADPLLRTYLAAGALALACFVFAPQAFPLLPEPPPLGQVATIAQYARAHGVDMQRRYDGSSATGRIEIFSFSGVKDQPEPYPFMFYAQDSSAGSTLVHWDGVSRSQRTPGARRSEVERLCTDTIYAAGYFVPRDEVLVIGLGGGPDMLCALYHEAKRVDVVEINPRTIEAIHGPFASFLGNAPRSPAVHFHLRDGRSFVRSTSAGRYDLIQLSGTDTKQNLASGALLLAENHLYTVEAFEDYLRALTPNGVLAIVRFGEAEALRLANTAMLALRRLGRPNPERHVAIAQNGLLQGVLVRRTPLSESDSLQLSTHLSPRAFDGVDVFFARLYELPFHERVTLGYAPHQPSNPRLTGLFTTTPRVAPAAFVRRYPFDIEPTTDDRPFFFDIFRHDDLGTWLRAPHVRLLRDLLSGLALLALVLVLLPVLRNRQGLRATTALFTLPYFACLGFGFLFVEVWLLSLLSMYLGHQTQGLAVVLSGLLVTSGIGAFYGERVLGHAPRRAVFAAAAVAALLTLASFAIGQLTNATLGQPLSVRVLLALLMIAPLGVCMGACMPAGLEHVRHVARPALPLCIGINGFASVLATVTVLPISLYFGYTGVLLTAAGLYVLASALAVGFHAKHDA
jgi:hypothetical protein